MMSKRSRIGNDEELQSRDEKVKNDDVEEN